MLVPGVSLGKSAAKVFDPDLWRACFRSERTAFRGLAASSVLASCHRRLCELEKLPRYAWRDGTLQVSRSGDPRPMPLLPFADQALRLMDAAGVGSEGATLFTTEGGAPMPPGNLREQIVGFGRRHGIAENLPSNLLATFREAVGGGEIADGLFGRAAPVFDIEEERAFLEACHPLMSIVLPSVTDPAFDTPVARALACTSRRELDEEARERVRLAEFPELYEAWTERKLDATHFSMYLGLDNVARWIRRYREKGVAGLKQKLPSPNRKKAFIVDLRRKRGHHESEAAFRKHLDTEHGIVVSESWLSKVLAKAGVLGLRIAQKEWREKVVEIFKIHAPVRDARKFWKEVLCDEHGYPYTLYCARATVAAAGLEFSVPARDPARVEERRRLVLKLYKLHAPVRRLDVFLEMLREKHGVKMELKRLREILDEAGLRPKQAKKFSKPRKAAKRAARVPSAN
ncbi:hypothetical protein PMN64_00480 [Bradyrhizobium sp. UFLA01-814]|uniref:hypothetical protein n=1 Tax=Bradyrhizobium sp. UFLA01-814 TaxID=3023480 RepID=UPI00398B812C